MQKVCANDISVPTGKVVYTQLLNERSGIEADLTVTKLAEGEYFIVTGGTAETRDFDWIKRHIPAQAHAFLTNVGSAYARFGVMGPKAGDLLSRLAPDNLSNESFPYATARFIDVAYARPLALRMSFAGELSGELYVPTDFATGVFDAIMDAGGFRESLPNLREAFIGESLGQGDFYKTVLRFGSGCNQQRRE